MTSMNKISVVIAAAGKGSRSGLPYPKTLFKIDGHTILFRILNLVNCHDSYPSIIVSPDGKNKINQYLNDFDLNAELLLQTKPTGMGDALLCFKESCFYADTDHIILIWGDIPFIESQTLDNMIKTHITKMNDFTFVTRKAEKAYTIVSRNKNGSVKEVIETRELGLKELSKGERDIGLFIFKKDPVMDILSKRPITGIGSFTGEHGFLYVIKELVQNGKAVEALPIAKEKELVSFNKLADIEKYI